MRGDFDICIVGGSIAGATLACHLAREGFEICLFEKRNRGTRKLCAELAHVSLFDRVELLTGCDCRHAVSARLDRVEVGAGRFELGRDFELGKGVTVDRVALEGALLDHALQLGVGVYEPQQVRSVTATASEGVTVATDDHEVAAQVVVGADGAASLVGRKLSRPWRRDEIGATRQVRLALDPHRLSVATTMRFDLLADASGYGWLVPYAGEVGIGAGAVAGPLDRLFGELLRRHGARCDLKLGELAEGRILGAPVPAAGPSRPTWGTRFLLVGDAGGFVSPASGEGMSLALDSVGAAAGALKLAFLAGRFSHKKLRHYERLWRGAMPDFSGLLRLRSVMSGSDGVHLLEACSNDLERLILLSPLVGTPDKLPQAEQIIARIQEA